ncbi:hypothetical protein F4818DRAFT_434452 [Hypoxylon cercidicola]|nr:hypothetical protein F4818DRAFT_434452 [Hypoxylon cercidicola]
MNSNTVGDSNKAIPCPHSDGKSTLVCWLCAENGYSPQGGGPPSPDDFDIEKNTFVMLGSSPLEVHPPAEGIEVGAPDPRHMYPGLEVVSGPTVSSWNGEPEQKAELASGPATIFGLRRRMLWIILIGVLVVLLIGVAIGSAVGVTQGKPSTDTPSAITSPTSSIASPATSAVTSAISLAMSSEAAASSTPSSLIQSTLTLSTTALSTSTKSAAASASSATSSTTSSTTSPTSTTTALATKDKTPISSSSTPTKPPPPPTTATTTVLVTPPVSTPTPPTVTVTPTPPTTTTPKPTPTSSAQPTSTLTPAQSNGYCLGQDGSTYTDPGTGSAFRVECDVAHQGKDIENREADSMEDCVSMCAENSRCVGAIWYNAGPQGTDLNYCWLKRTLEDDNIKDTADAQSVVRL